MTETVHIGAAAGFAGDRADAAGPLIAALSRCRGARFLMFETLAERTLALAQLEYRHDPQRGYSPAIERLVAPALKDCLEQGIRIVGNFGAACWRWRRSRDLRLRALRSWKATTCQRRSPNRNWPRAKPAAAR